MRPHVVPHGVPLTLKLCGRVQVSSDMSQLNVKTLTELWESTFLPSIRKEFKVEIDEVRYELIKIMDKFTEIEQSQKFLSDGYDNILQTLQATKKDITSFSSKVKDLEKRTTDIEESQYNIEGALDELQQYIRRDCVEVSGIPVLPNDNPIELAVELGNLLGCSLTVEDISIAHRLPNTTKSKDRMIIKFVRRESKDIIYKGRNRLVGKSTKDLPSVSRELGKSIHNTNRIFINESLTSYRKRLFGRINEFRRIHKWKHIWTVNGRILLRESDSSRVFSFTTLEQFDNFKS